MTRRSLFWIAAPGTLVIFAMLGVALGAVPLSVGDVVNALGGRGDPSTVAIVRSLRLPRVLLALSGAPAETTRGALWWMMGSVAGASWSEVGWLALYLGIGGGLLLHWASDIDALALGEDAAASLGVEVEAASRRIFIASSLV